MDYYLDTRYDSAPYDYVLVSPSSSADIDPSYITPSRRNRYSLDFEYGDDDDYRSYSSNARTSSTLAPASLYTPQSSMSNYVPDYTEDYLNRYTTPRSTSSYPYSYTPTSYNDDSGSDYGDVLSQSTKSTRPSTNYSVANPSQDRADEVYLDKMSRILGGGTCLGVPTEPTNIMGNIYVGRSSEAENADLIKRMKFTHLLNCGANKKVVRRSKHRRPQGPEVNKYEELYLYDGENEDLTPHLATAHSFLDSAVNSGGCVMLYDSGVSRSGAIMLSYMIKCGFPLLKSAQDLKNKRRLALCNTGFMKQLVRFARERGMLDTDVENVKAPKFGGPGDKHRLRSAHLPTFF